MRLFLIPLVVVAGLMLAACASEVSAPAPSDTALPADPAPTSPQPTTTLAPTPAPTASSALPPTTSVSPPSSSVSPPTTSPPPATSSPPPAPEQIELLVPEVLAVYPHDASAFTQGLLIKDGRLFESTGLWDESSIREIDLATGQVLRNLLLVDAELPDSRSLFAEGLALVEDDLLIQLTWQAGLAFVWDLETFDQTARPSQVFNYGPDQQGWGICYDGSRLAMSDGSDTLQFRNPETFDLIGEPLEVRLIGVPVELLNELECVGDDVWANVWFTDEIVRIDANTGKVTAVVDASVLAAAAQLGCADSQSGFQESDANSQARSQAPDIPAELLAALPPDLACPQDRSDAVLNGIAYDEIRDVFLLTGKLWPVIFEVRFVPAA